MKYWSWSGYVFCLLILLLLRRRGQNGFWRSLRLWGEGVTDKQRRENLIGLGLLLALAGIGFLFWLTD